MRKVLRILATLCALAFFAGCATPEPKKIDISNIPVQGNAASTTPGSLWPGETSRNTLFQDLRARNVGDIITIEITEKTSAIKEATTSTSRSSSKDIALANLFGLPSNLGMRNFLGQGTPFSPEVSSTYDSSFDGSGTTKRSGELSATITARVIKVLLNGNLVLEGKKDMVVNNELQYIILSGIARPEDITESNIVSSSQLSDARIEYSGKGVLADEQSQGWLGRILDNVWPF
ncbi:MAG: flagellar basal body L-ring protein FlgH [Deltaproteobacteria bacterium]|nr:flagellar basal body L-ring protein FlgH [Deltaproteobacteria bacterium]